jgi:hypothetical protein
MVSLSLNLSHSYHYCLLPKISDSGPKSDLLWPLRGNSSSDGFLASCWWDWIDPHCVPLNGVSICHRDGYGNYDIFIHNLNLTLCCVCRVIVLNLSYSYHYCLMPKISNSRPKSDFLCLLHGNSWSHGCLASCWWDQINPHCILLNGVGIGHRDDYGNCNTFIHNFNWTSCWVHCFIVTQPALFLPLLSNAKD